MTKPGEPLEGTWTPGAIAEYRQFLEGNHAVKDPVERALADIRDSLQRAWSGKRCLECPIAELVALAAATLKFYQENKRV